MAQSVKPAWSPQAQIPAYEAATEDPPFLVADQNHVIHAFNSQPLDLDDPQSARAIFYRQWMVDGGWSQLIDIIVNPSGGHIDLMDVYLDPNDVVHLLMQMNHQDIYYSQALLATAGRAASWSTPVRIGEQALGITPGITALAALQGDGKGNLVAVYSGSQNGNGLYRLHSSDNGGNWSAAEPLYLTYDADLIVVAPRLALGEGGRIHAVWSTFQADGAGGPGFYAQYEIERQQWSTPVDLDIPGIRTPNVVEYNGEIIVAYYHHSVNQNWWRRSRDNGQTWSVPQLVAPVHIGTNKAVSFAVDSNDVLHVFFGQRIDDQNHGLWHSVLTDSGWIAPEAVVRGPRVRDEVGGRGFDPTAANAIISNGNLVLVTWGTDGAAGINGAWYAYGRLNAAELPAHALRSPVVVATATAVQTPEPAVLATATPLPLALRGEPARTVTVPNPGLPIMVGLMPTVLLVSIAVMIRRRRRR